MPKEFKESSTTDAILEADSQLEALQVKAQRAMDVFYTSLNKLFIQQVAQKLISSPHQPYSTAAGSIMDPKCGIRNLGHI